MLLSSVKLAKSLGVSFCMLDSLINLKDDRKKKGKSVRDEHTCILNIVDDQAEINGG